MQPLAPPAGWQTFDGGPDGYQLSLPAGWLPRLRSGSTPSVRYFASADVQAPLEMTADAVWLSVVVGSDTASACASPPSGTVIGSSHAWLGGAEATAYLVGPIAGGVEPTWKTTTATYRQGTCYQLVFVTIAAATQQAQQATMVQIEATFRFS